MTKWNANNYSRLMVIDLKRIKQLKLVQQQLQQVALNGQLPATPMYVPLVPQPSVRRRSSRPTLFSMNREREELENISNSGILRESELYQTTMAQSPQSFGPTNYPNSSVIRPSNDHLTPSANPNWGKNSGSVVPLSHGIYSIRQENDSILSSIDNSPVQYGGVINGTPTE
jgi:hypothetical protein